MRTSWLLLLTLLLVSCGTGGGVATLPPAAPPTVQPTGIPTPTNTPAPTNTPVPQIEVQYYKIRVEYGTSSDFTRLEILDSPNILTYSVQSVSGNPAQAAVFADAPGQYRIELNRPITAVETQPTVSMIVDFAFASSPPLGRIRFIQEKGVLNDSTLRVLLLNGSDQVVLHERTQVVEHAEFTSDLTSVNQYTPLTGQVPQVSNPKMLWAFYDPGYRGDTTGFGGWQDPMYTDRPMDLYSSADKASVENQVNLAQGAGIDGFIVSFSGLEEPDSDCIRQLLVVSEQKGFHIAFMIEGMDYSAVPGGGDPVPVDAIKIKDLIRTTLSYFGNNPAYMRVNGKPLVLLYGAHAVTGDVYQQIFTQLEAEGLSATYWGSGYQGLDYYDGVFEYGIPSGDMPGIYTAFGRAVTYHSLLSQDPAPKMWAATVEPGFDNTPLYRWYGRWPLATTSRRNGAFYRSTFDQALQSGADWIIITSWNSFQDNTQIEPSETFGTQYLDITSEYSQTWKLTSAPSP